jgi:hypothetical protein
MPLLNKGGYAMLSFPPSIEIESEGKRLCFHVKPLAANQFAEEHHLHSLENDDSRIFGYIIYKEEYLYVYCIEPEQQYGHRLLYGCYVGPWDKIELSPENTSILFQSIAISVVQLSLFEHRHPAYVTKDTFSRVHRTLIESLDGMNQPNTTPFVTPVYELAIDLRDFYDEMARSLDELPKEGEDQQDNH